MSGLMTTSAGDASPNVKYLEWSDRLEIGVTTIDEQHKRFFELSENLSDSDNEMYVMKTLVILCDYVRLHFTEEEALMVAVEYPHREAHCKMHREFRQMLGDLLGRARQMELDEIANEVKTLINVWFYQHIVIEDLAYAPYVAPARTSPHGRSS